MKPHIPPAYVWVWRSFEFSCAFSALFAFLMLAIPVHAQSSQPAGSIADAARSIREQKSSSVKPAKIFTNEEFGEQASTSVNPAPSDAAILPALPLKPAASLPNSTAVGCNSPDAQRLERELQSAQQELDQLRSGLSYKPAVISDGDVDLKSFKSGSSGLNVGAPPVAQSQPLSSERVTEVVLEEKILSLKKSETIACDPPADAKIQQKVDTLEQELQILQSEFALDQSAYYSKTDYASDVTGKARLDAKQQRIMDLQSEIQGLRTELAAPK